jgi:hypothetical protein
MPVQHGPRYHDTKLVGDIAVQQAVLQGLQHGWGVLVPVGDRLPYDLVFDTGSYLVRIQVKSAYCCRGVWVANAQRAKTNRKRYRFECYKPGDFDAALIWHPSECRAYIMRYKSHISLSAKTMLPYANAWRHITPATPRGGRHAS